EQGTVGIAVPIFDSTGEQVAALGLVGRLPGIGVEQLQESLPALQSAAKAIGGRVGEREPKRRSRRRAESQQEA
ncbi:MAG TPA: IclR family transcriptional regulator C-terminal domain-containing protein, partial [Thermoanaerobaculia bacterium]|nr:IclR family transcriptional regulator C-terminal domain-containing protein [Thermoanaerobaculia bacterium]